MCGIAKDRVLFHPAHSQRQRRMVAHTTQRGHGAPPCTTCELAPYFGARTVGAKVIHIDAILAEQGQNVLGGPYELCSFTIFHRLAQGCEPVFIFGCFGKVQGADQVLGSQLRGDLLGCGAQGQGWLILWGGRWCGGRNRARLSVVVALALKCRKGGLGFACRGGNLVQFTGN